MKPNLKAKADLEKRFKKAVNTPAGFGFFKAIHDFIEHIESNPSLLRGLSKRIKSNRDLKIPTKYNYLKLIYQGVEDTSEKSNTDLGHARYAVLLEIKRISNNDVSDSNSFWKKRELSRKLIAEIYGVLNPQKNNQ